MHKVRVKPNDRKKEKQKKTYRLEFVLAINHRQWCVKDLVNNLVYTKKNRSCDHLSGELKPLLLRKNSLKKLQLIEIYSLFLICYVYLKTLYPLNIFLCRLVCTNNISKQKKKNNGKSFWLLFLSDCVSGFFYRSDPLKTVC